MSNSILRGNSQSSCDEPNSLALHLCKYSVSIRYGRKARVSAPTRNLTHIPVQCIVKRGFILLLIEF